jgi:hypothetical protein
MALVHTADDSRRLDRHRADGGAEPAAWATATAPESDPDTDQPRGAGPVCRAAPGRSGCGRGCRWYAPDDSGASYFSTVGGIGFGAGTRAAGGAVPLRGPGRLPIVAGPVGMRTRMPAVRIPSLGPPSR